MIFPENLFTSRQFMINPDFELYHYKNTDTLNVELHHHDFYEVFIFLSGNVEYFIEGMKYNLVPGDILLINNKELHRPEIKPGAPYERIVLFIRPEFIMSRSISGANLSLCFDSHLRGHNRLLHPEDALLETIKSTIIKFLNLANSSIYGANILKELYITEFLIFLNQCYIESMQKTETTRIYNKFIEKTIDYINTNIESELTLDAIANELFVSKYHLSHYFKRYTGISLHSYIKYKRLLIAQSVLRSGASVTTACQKCGFGDYNNFIRAFKELYGVSPKKFSKSDKSSNPIVE